VSANIEMLINSCSDQAYVPSMHSLEIVEAPLREVLWVVRLSHHQRHPSHIEQ
jgi:hypothetical protein